MSNIDTGSTVRSFVALKGVTKRFGPVVANRSVDIDVATGEVLALVGENGAGKSTIVNMLAGLLRPDEGSISVNGQETNLTSPTASIAAGIGVVHQHYVLVPTLSALENIALQMTEYGLGRIDRNGLATAVLRVSTSLGFAFDLDAKVEDMDVAHQQRIEIVKALMREVRLLILDEPTAVLGANDREKLFETIGRLKARGTSVILITHKLDDIFQAADRVVVLKAGAVSLSCSVSDTDPKGIIRAMVGDVGNNAIADIVDGGGTLVVERQAKEACCSVKAASLLRANGSLAVSDLSLDVHFGEILAVAGVDGNGQSEFVRCLAGLARPFSGHVDCLGVSSSSTGWNTAFLRSVGVSHIPEDRRRSGIVGAMSLADNYLLGHLHNPEFVRHGFIDRRKLGVVTTQMLKDYEVRARGPSDPIANLSGGNQQKLVLARELAGEPKLILAAHPSRGLDIKTIRFVHKLLADARAEGKAVIFQSSDIDEILTLADRILVFAGGRAFGPVDCRGLSRKQVGAWIAGQEDLP
ncbi:ABC transporter ATP-binding protein [Rhizobium sp. ARZ01]|uniref:ABC transporter ATP-binding protein n=1 Tax=Rhizobium sp. ARZ01 TaxID=2769313 RepID=UPI001780DE60|nr:ABC transporter ATP-binding protein [Rhizobium sp. ARZ01]MBD9375445.1 ABC transporter ATP-binding protein [Rhizobium sp. ARZ01]